MGSDNFSLDITRAVIYNGGVEMATLAVRRASSPGEGNILNNMLNITLLPNTSGVKNAEEVVCIARLAKELGCGDFVKIEIIRDSKHILPDNCETIRAVRTLANEGFISMSCMMPNLFASRSMADAGAAATMLLGTPIESNRGLLTRDFVKMIVEEVNLPVIVDAGIGKPSQACKTMELGSTAVMVNTAVATARDVHAMARAFKTAIEAGRLAYLSRPERILEDRMEASSPLTGFLMER